MNWQTLTSVTALVIAVAAFIVPAVQNQRRMHGSAKERRLEAQCLATAIRFAVHDLAVQLSTVRLTAVSGSVDETLQKTSAAQLLLGAKIEVPAVLTDSTSRIHILGYPAGPTMLRLMAVLNVYNESIDRQANLCLTNPALSAADHWRAVAGFVDDVRPVFEEAMAQLNVIADGSN
ncbi:MAG: hypothetical protein ACREEL_00110 [Stellaceae bacterium]